jgi:phenylpropionate dioxygenase-like ring-hydroxylating dioxygenase large terminal subunit
MLNREDNELLTRVGPGTAMGELFRRFWLPAVPSHELPKPDGTPVRLRLLGEDLIAFRDTDGRVGLVSAYCPHRGASLFYGRNEEGGLRCVYHGWKFDAWGTCVEIPSEGVDSTYRTRIGLTAYPTEEAGGVVWTYMGPPQLAPERPRFEWTRVPDSHRNITVWVQETNWLQGAEGEIDSAHVSFLHTTLVPSEQPATVHRTITALDKKPKLIARETPYGMMSVARRNAGDGNYYWRVTQWLLPMYSLVPAYAWPVGGRAWVPIDDEHTYTWDYAYYPDRPLPDRYFQHIKSGPTFPPELDRCVYRLPNGTRIDTWRPRRNADNEFLLDREVQRTKTFTGIYGINDQDRAIQGSMGPICDRSREHLVATDAGIIMARRRLLKLAKDLQQGLEPPPAAHGAWYNVRPLDVVSPHAELDAVLEAHGADMRGQVA